MLRFLATALAIVAALYLVLWLRSLIAKRVTVIDPFWGLGFPVLGFALVRASETPAMPRTWLLLALISVWALRYASHIWARSWGHDEASLYYPYAEQRAKYGRNFWWISLFTVFVPQMLGHLVIGLPMLMVVYAPGPAALGVLDWLGAAIGLIGITIEGVADTQMRRFKADPSRRGTMLDTGLWRYSRHPNYFGDALTFWGLGLIALASPLGAWGLIGPAVLNLLLRTQGVHMLETRSKIAKRPEYAEYVRRTSAFVPWWPKA
ncbi:DUF1295 domain-containing protein [Nannocystaceae bacterium ST9]